MLAKILTSPEVKKRVFDELRSAAKKSDTKLDDAGVDAAEVVWDVIVPIVAGAK